MFMFIQNITRCKLSQYYHDNITMTEVERKSDFKLTPDTPYLAPTGELYGVFWGDLGEKWPRYNDITL